MTTRTTTSTGHTLTHSALNPTRLCIQGTLETMQYIPDTELHAFAASVGMTWDGDVIDETTLRLRPAATEAVSAGIRTAKDLWDRVRDLAGNDALTMEECRAEMHARGWTRYESLTEEQVSSIAEELQRGSAPRDSDRGPGPGSRR